jgi:EAL domain-containing protein (putative c-di-GMP-specific phosphodiesterase class I)
LDPALLDLELTESLLLEDVEHVLETLKRLKALGVKISIDDFGTGYSSLAYLKRFDVDTLKIDQSFVREIPTDPEDQAIVKAIIGMAHALRLEVLAEGVETEDMARRLQEYGCELAQGYLYARPLPAEAFQHWFEQLPK